MSHACAKDAEYCRAACCHCGQHLEFPRQGSGSIIACPACGLDTPLDSLPDEPEITPELSAAELQEAFVGATIVPGISFFYQFGLVLVVLFMILLPVAYLALAAGLACGVYWYATHAQVLFSFRGGGVYGLMLRVLLYGGPLIGGGIAVFFMFKPLLARGPKRCLPLELNPAVHPRLYQFIAQISDLLRTPMPRGLELDSELGASAGFRRGWRGFLSRDLVLTLGLPLIWGFTTRQLAVVVAHELGHCRQSLAMRLQFVINSINRWFVRVVYQRDAWDDALEEWMDEAESGWVTAIVLCARCAVGLSRLVLKLFMYAGHAAMCYLSRQMEYHADACSVATAGSGTVESSLLRLRELSLIANVAGRYLRHFWEKRRQLPYSVPELLAHLEAKTPTGNYFATPPILHPTKSPARFYQIFDKGPDDLVSDEPTISISSPANGFVASDLLTISVTASTDQGSVEHRLYVDGQEMWPSGDGTNYVINTCEWGNGTHILFATARSSTAVDGPDISYGLMGHAVSPFVPVVFSNLVTRISFSEPFFRPALGQTQQVSAVFAANSDWTLHIKDIYSNTVRTATGSGNSMHFNWEGTGDGGTAIPDGVYYYYISAQTNGQPSQSENFGGGGTGTNDPPSPSFASRSSTALAGSTDLFAMPADGSGSAVPFVLYPPGFDTNTLLIFEASWSEVMPPRAAARPATTLDSGTGGAAYAYSGPSSEAAPPAPTRPPLRPARARLAGSQSPGRCIMRMAQTRFMRHRYWIII